MHCVRCQIRRTLHRNNPVINAIWVSQSREDRHEFIVRVTGKSHPYCASGGTIIWIGEGVELLSEERTEYIMF